MCVGAWLSVCLMTEFVSMDLDYLHSHHKQPPILETRGEYTLHSTQHTTTPYIMCDMLAYHMITVTLMRQSFGW